MKPFNLLFKFLFGTFILAFYPSKTFSEYSWIQKANFGGGVRYSPVVFPIGDKVYIGTGLSSVSPLTYKKDFWEYDPVTDSWSQKADFAGTARYAAADFVINNKGYLVTGNDGSFKKDCWEYDPALNVWNSKNSFPGVARHTAISFVLNNKGYLGTGWNGSLLKDFWEYDPTLDSWIAKKDYPLDVQSAKAFVTNERAFVGTGFRNNMSIKDFFEYDPLANDWLRRADFSGFGRYGALSFSLNNFGFLGYGMNSNNYFNDIWKYDPITDSWQEVSGFDTEGSVAGVGFAINNYAYAGMGRNNLGNYTSKFFRLSDVTNVVSNESNQLLKIYPNPSEGVIRFSIQNSMNENSKITVFTTSGKAVFEDSIENSNGSIDLHHLPKGIYLIEIVMSGKKSVEKVIII
jgi:N-acetylneuraminic acid mutarotase